MILADVNVWLATIVEAHPDHHRAIEWWRGDILPAGETVLFCRLTQLGLLRLLSNEAVMGASRRSPREAWDDYEGLLSQEPVGYREEPEGLEEALRQLTEDQRPSSSLWADAYLAAFTKQAGLTLATFDRGFRRFTGIRLGEIR